MNSSFLPLTGLHHVTAIAGDPRRNVEFYTRVLGLRLIKKTVNFDDPTTYHLYYGDSVGTPGSVLTFFPWAGVRRGRPGHGQVYATAFSVPAGALSFWAGWLKASAVATSPVTERFGDQVLAFTDPDGLRLELIATAAPDLRPAHLSAEIPATAAIRGFHGITIALANSRRTEALLTGTMGYRSVQTVAHRTRLELPVGVGGYVDLLTDPTLPSGLAGAGTVHHVAFRTPNDTTQATALHTLRELGYQPSPVMDRNYFHSIYYREPAGVLFEIATDNPGFAIDEPLDALGTTLQLPAQYESQRAAIEAALPKLS
jgi:glyoxalase family protein